MNYSQQVALWDWDQLRSLMRDEENFFYESHCCYRVRRHSDNVRLGSAVLQRFCDLGNERRLNWSEVALFILYRLFYSKYKYSKYSEPHYDRRPASMSAIFPRKLLCEWANFRLYTSILCASNSMESVRNRRKGRIWAKVWTWRGSREIAQQFVWIPWAHAGAFNSASVYIDHPCVLCSKSKAREPHLLSTS